MSDMTSENIVVDADKAKETKETKEPVSQSADLDQKLRRHLKKRRGKEWRFKMMGRGAVIFALASLFWLLTSVVGTGLSAFYQHYLTLPVTVDLQDELLGKESSPENIRRANYRNVVSLAMHDLLPDVTDIEEQSEIVALVSASGASNHIRQLVFNDPSLLGQDIVVKVPVSDQVDQLLKGNISRELKENRRKISDQQIGWIDQLKENGVIKRQFNSKLFVNPDSRDPELAGIAGAVMGSAMIVFIAFILALPIGVGSALYLNEFAPKNRWTDIIEININNLAAVPSIVFGLLGLAIFINLIGFERSLPLVGGMVLALRAFPTIVIATRASLESVSPSLVDGALSLGASHTQAVFQHKLPLAAPGILTGSIIAMAQVLGETAPLLMIGMVAFVTEVPQSVTDPSTALPVQIFLWSDSAERAWSERTAAAIIVLLVFLLMMNGAAIWLRNRLEKRQ